MTQKTTNKAENRTPSRIAEPTQKQMLESILDNQSVIMERVTWINRIVKPMAVLMLGFVLFTAASSIKCNIVPIPPNPIPNPSPNPSPQPQPDTDKQKAIDICMTANGMNTTHTYQQRLVWASQEIVQQLGWPTEKAVDFAREYVTNH